MRILHLIDGGGWDGARGWSGCGDDALTACGLTLESREFEHRVCMIGGPGSRERAGSLGVAADLVCIPPSGMAALARRRLRRFAASWNPDVVHLWNGRAAALAGCVEPSHGFVVMADGGAMVPRIRRMGAGRTVVVVPVADADHEGVGAGASVVAAPPAVRLAPNVADAGPRARAELGLNQGDVAVLLLGSAPHGDAMRFVFLIQLLREAGCDAAGLIPADAAQVARAARFHRASPGQRFVVSTRVRGALLAAADLAVWVGAGPGPTACWEDSPGSASMPIGQAHAAGVPAVAPRWAMIPELYDPESAGHCLGHNAALPELARLLLPLIEDAARRRHVSGLVRSHLREQDPGAGFVGAVERAWAMAAGARPPAARVGAAGALV